MKPGGDVRDGKPIESPTESPRVRGRKLTEEVKPCE